MADARLAVLGSPIDHSQSPALHVAAYRTLGLDWEYGRFEVAEAELASFLDAHDDWAGFSLTMPLKTELVRLSDERGWAVCLLYTSPSPRDATLSRMPSSA